MMPPQLAIVIPTYDERTNIAPLVDRIAEALHGIEWEIIFVDDNSPDGTADEARLLAASDRRIRIIQRIGRRGLASAVLEGFCATAAKYVAVMDADHQHDPALLTNMLTIATRSEADVVVASRFVEGADTQTWNNQERERVSHLSNAIARRLTGIEIADPMSGYFLLPASLARSLVPKLSGIGFKILLDLLIAGGGALRVREVPMRFAARLSGDSKLDRAIAFDALAALYDKLLGRIVPTRFALFGTVGALGVAVHLAIFYSVLLLVGLPFVWSQAMATLSAMTFNFWLNNALTYRDRRLVSATDMARGWISFVAACSVGALANVAVSSLLFERGLSPFLAALTGIAVGSVWNFALSSRFVWGRY